MEYVVFVIIIGLIVIYVSNAANIEKEQMEKLSMITRTCPPHKWNWEEQPGIDPPVYFIRCQRCKMLPSTDH